MERKWDAIRESTHHSGGGGRGAREREEEEETGYSSSAFRYTTPQAYIGDLVLRNKNRAATIRGRRRGGGGGAEKETEPPIHRVHELLYRSEYDINREFTAARVWYTWYTWYIEKCPQNILYEYHLLFIYYGC